MPKTPSFRQRAGSSQAIVTLTDSSTGKRRDYWLGEYGRPSSREAYHRVVAEWEANSRRLPDRGNAASSTQLPQTGVSVAEIVLAYWRWARENHRNKRASSVRVTLRLLRKLDGSTPAAAYGPKRLRLLREAMILRWLPDRGNRRE